MATLKSEISRRAKLVKTQISVAYPVWIFVVCLVVGFLIAELTRKFFGTEWMYTLGVTIEIIGILFVALEVATVRSQVGMPGFLSAILAWITNFRFLIIRPKPIEARMSGTVSMGFSARGRLTQASKSRRLPDRLDAIEANLNQVQKELDQIYNKFDSSEKSVAALINEKTQILAENIESQKQLIAEIAAGDSAIKLVGVLLVLFGFIVQNFPSAWAPSPLI